MFADGRQPSVQHEEWRQRSANVMQVGENTSGRAVKDLAAECDQNNLFALWNSMPSDIHRASVFHKLSPAPDSWRMQSDWLITRPGTALFHPGCVPASRLVFLGWSADILRPATEDKTGLEKGHRITSLKVFLGLSWSGSYRVTGNITTIDNFVGSSHTAPTKVRINKARIQMNCEQWKSRDIIPALWRRRHIPCRVPYFMSEWVIWNETLLRPPVQ